MPASSNSSNTPPSSKKRGVKAEIDHDDDISDPPSTPVKKARKTAASSSPSKADAWTAEERVKLFEAYQTCAQIKWDEVAREFGGGKTAVQCRKQWTRATGKKIKDALADKI